MNSNLLVISGIPRSRTSLMMCVMAEVLGEEAILGKKFPQKVEYQYNEKDPNYDKKIYFSKLAMAKYEEKQKHTEMMNPNGFWEFQGTMGFVYDINTKEIIKHLQRNSYYACKIVSSGLARTQPDLIGKIIYMLRNPLEIAQSQENLVRNMKFKDEQGNVFDFEKDPETNEKIKINSLDMFFDGTLKAAQFFLENHPIKVYFCDSDNLIKNPKEELKKIDNFINPGIEVNGKLIKNDINNCEIGAKLINTKLYRSRNNTPKNEEEVFALFIYDLFKEKKYEEVIKEILSYKNKNIKKEWYCPRFALFDNEDKPFIIGNMDNCERCYKNIKGYRDALIQDADSRGVDYKNIACPYECMYIKAPISIEESIKNNFWL